MELPKPWPRKPPKGQYCDATVEMTSGLMGEPLLVGCPEEAVETLIGGPFGHEVWLCKEHADFFINDYEGRWEYFRNPRHK